MARNRPKRNSFFCPISNVPWSWGFIYKDCPLASDQRNMEECRNCSLHGNMELFRKEKHKPRRDVSNKDKKQVATSEDGVTKGKTFTGDKQ